jgi:hypothetical protein
MIVLDYETGCQMMDVCRAVDAATEIDDTFDEDHDMGDMIYEMTLHLGSAPIALLGPHVMVEQQVAGFPAEMAEIYDDFYNTAGGSLLSTTMPADILDIALGFNNYHAETSI